jgi:hypothetical protein
VHRCFQVALVGDPYDDLRNLPDFDDRAGDGPVVAQHPHGRLAQPLGDWRDPQVQHVPIGQFTQHRTGRLGKSVDVGREHVIRAVPL